MEKNTWENIAPQRTIDGVRITPGLKVWDYNYSNTLLLSEMRTVIEPNGYVGGDGGVVWFTLDNGGTFDGSRMWARRPW